MTTPNTPVLTGTIGHAGTTRVLDMLNNTSTGEQTRLASIIEHLIDEAALAGVFADLADRPSIEVTTLFHADRTVWICMEFDRGHRLLRAGPVPIAELLPPNLTGDKRIAGILARVRHLMATAIVLDDRRIGARTPVEVRHRARLGRVPLFALTGPVISDAMQDTVRTAALSAVQDPDSPVLHLGRALADWQDNPPSRAQTAGPDSLPLAAQDVLDRAEDAEHDLTDLLGPATINLNLFSATTLVADLIHAVATGDTPPEPEAPTAVALACAKRRSACEDLLTSARHAQRFVLDHTLHDPAGAPADLRIRIGQVFAAAVQASTMAVMLTELAEDADAHGEPHAAHAADQAAAGFETALVRAEVEAWSTAVQALYRTGDARTAGETVTAWERTTGFAFAADWHRSFPGPGFTTC